MLRTIALLICDLNAGIRRDQRVHEVDAPLRPVSVEIRELMTPGTCGRNVGGCAHLDGPSAEAHIAELWVADLRQSDGRGLTVNRQQDTAQHLPRIGVAFSVRDLTVAVRINPGKYLPCHGHAGREIDLQTHMLVVYGEPRRLEVLVEPMRGGRRGSRQPDAKEGDPHERSAHTHGTTSLAP